MKLKSTVLALLLLLCSPLLKAQCFVTASSTDCLCGLCNGSAVLAFSGGTPPYAVNFNGMPYGTASATLSIPNLCPGTYYYSVTDVNNVVCTGSLNIAIGNQGTPPTATLTYQNPSCQSCNDGTITAYVSGGTPPYTYWWSNGASAPIIGNLGAGVYSLYVSDMNGCSDTVFVSLSYGGQPLYLLSGRAYYDINGDSVFNSPDLPLANQLIIKQPAGQVAYTDSNGMYLFGDTAGSFTLSYVQTGAYHPVQVNNQHQVTISNANISGLDFALQPDSMYHASSVYTYIPFPRCNTSRYYTTSIRNDGTYIDSGIVTFTFDSLLTPTSWSAGGSVNGQTITFPFSNLLPTQTQNFYTWFNMPGPNNSLLKKTVSTVVDGAGQIVAMDSSLGSDMVLCSFDPNDKQVDPIGEGPSHFIPMNSELRYLIRFQNTGNDTAYNVMIADTIDPAIDLNTVYVIATSHPAYFLKDGTNILKVYFDNIYLPDSTTDEDASHGYLLFRCFGNASNPDPTVITNSAAIFFDANPPVLTNAVFNTLTNAAISVEEPSVTQNGITLLPNPTESYTLVSIENFNGEEEKIDVFSVNGALIESHNVYNGSYLLDTRNWEAGLYLVRLTDKSNGKSRIARLSVH